MNHFDYKNKDQVMKISHDLKKLNLFVYAVVYNDTRDVALCVETKIRVKGRRKDIEKLKEMGFEKVWGERFCGSNIETYRKTVGEG